VLVADIMKINNDRIAIYQKAVEMPNIDKCLKRNLQEIVSKGMEHRDELIEKITELNGNSSKSGTTLLGKIYRAWVDLRVAFSYSSEKAVISSCLYNEEIALHAYVAATDTRQSLNADITRMIEKHKDALRNSHEQIRKYRETRHIANFSLMYFN
jgi:uncharacterized protein (TIGR02284 family)